MPNLYEVMEFNRSLPMVTLPTVRFPGGNISISSPFPRMTDSMPFAPDGSSNGELIIASLPARAGFADLFDSFMEHGRNHLWRWCAARYSARAILSWKPPHAGGNAVGCDCGTFANALIVLATEEPPFGLGLTEPVALVTDRGLYGHGFITRRFRAGGVDPSFLGNLVANPPLDDRTGASVFTEHNVVEYRQQLFDVTTGRALERTGGASPLSNIITHDLTGYQERHLGPTKTMCEMVALRGQAATELLLPLGPDSRHQGRWTKYRFIDRD